MAKPPTGQILWHIRKLVEKQTVNRLPDRFLLERFLTRHEEAAFAALVQRHGPLVQRVCWRVLGHVQDAEDAFQATFLVLARRAAAIQKRESVGPWLYGVAYRLARKLKVRSARRHTQERQAPARTPTGPFAEAVSQEFSAALDEELSRLPEHYQAPLLLCGLEGKTRDEAAEQLGWSLGTFKRRLEKGRSLLRSRLARRGLAPSAALCASLLAHETSRAAVAPGLVVATTRMALSFGSGSAAAHGAIPARLVALAQEAVQASAAVKVKLGAALALLLGLVAAGTATLTRPTPAERGAGFAPAPQGAAELAPEDKDAPRTDRYGDPLPAGALRRLGTVRFRHGEQIYAIACSPNGKLIASGGMGGLIRLWEADLGRPCGSLAGHRVHVFALMFSADGRRLVSAGSEDADMHLADLDHQGFGRREAASRQLAAFGAEAEPALVRALASRPSPELRSRAGALLEQIAQHKKPPTDDDLRLGRALAVLERVGTPKARHLLDALCVGAQDTPLGQQARAVLDRLFRLPAEPR